MWKDIGGREAGQIRPNSFANRVKSHRLSTLQLSNYKDIVSPHKGSINSLQVLFYFSLSIHSTCLFNFLQNHYIYLLQLGIWIKLIDLFFICCSTHGKHAFCIEFSEAYLFWPWNQVDLTEERYLLSGASDSSVAVYDVQRATDYEGGGHIAKHRSVFVVDKQHEHGHKYAISSAIWYPVDTGLFVTGSYDHYVKVWDTNCTRVLILSNFFSLFGILPHHAGAISWLSYFSNFIS